ncbi:hypothetical protein [Asaia sp. As-1742]|uniref:hypothetical protein n=1 Tax=Asaia sp. As-1742 TaxID=2608325 RepID=UPI00141FABA2|nr:hypothetical protein [Asaia sp. As-1742]NIE81766.1 hypothetical protein [Asaia sp. As-1742]
MNDAVAARLTFRMTEAARKDFELIAAHVRDTSGRKFVDRSLVFRSLIADTADRIRKGCTAALKEPTA